MNLLSQHTVDLYTSVFQSGAAAVQMGSVLPSLAAEPPAYFDNKREFLIRTLRGSPQLDGLYLGYPSGAFVQMINVARNARWRAAVSAPDKTAFAMRTILPAADGSSTSTWRFIDDAGAILDQRSAPNLDYDPRLRPWYRAAVGRNVPVSLGRYVSASTDSLTYSVASGLWQHTDIVMGADVLLETISLLLTNSAVSDHATGYIFDADDQLIVHSERTRMKAIVDGFEEPKGRGARTGDDDLALKAIRQLLSTTRDRNNRLIEIRVGNEPYLARLATFSAVDMPRQNTVAIAAPLADFTAPSVRLVERTLAVAAALVAAGMVAALFLSRIISRALTALSEDARQIGNLEFAGRHMGHSWISEINMLAEALGAAREAIGTFALYVPRELVRRIIASGKAVSGAPPARTSPSCSPTSSDFTTISEQHPPETVIDLLTTYFQLINAIVERNNGVIVQYLGDSVYGMWNAPIANSGMSRMPAAARSSAKAAIAALNEANHRAGKPPLITRFGIHTGVAVVGSFGAEQRRQYTAMGDTVNVASRLEGLNKEFGTTILVSAAVRDACDPGFQFRDLGLAHAKGRQAAIPVYELLG